MSFVKRELTKEEAQALIKEYKLTCPFPYSYAIENSLNVKVADEKNDVQFMPIRRQLGSVVDGAFIDPFLGGIYALIWGKYKIRVEIYQNIVDDFRKTVLTVVKIVAPSELHGQDSTIIKIIEDSIAVLFDCKDSTQDKKEISYRDVKVEYKDREDVWNL